MSFNRHFCVGECLINEKVPTNLFSQLQERLESYLKTHEGIPDSFDDDQVLAATVESLHISNEHAGSLDNLKVHLFKYAKPETRKLDIDSGSFYSLEYFPNEHQLDLWESLHFGDNLKDRIYCYIAAIFKFASVGLANASSISFNRIILLHGPPGTGKKRRLIARLLN